MARELTATERRANMISLRLARARSGPRAALSIPSRPRMLAQAVCPSASSVTCRMRRMRLCSCSSGVRGWRGDALEDGDAAPLLLSPPVPALELERDDAGAGEEAADETDEEVKAAAAAAEDEDEEEAGAVVAPAAEERLAPTKAGDALPAPPTLTARGAGDAAGEDPPATAPTAAEEEDASSRASRRWRTASASLMPGEAAPSLVSAAGAAGAAAVLPPSQEPRKFMMYWGLAPVGGVGDGRVRSRDWARLFA